MFHEDESSLVKVVEHEGKIFVSSKEIAERFGKQHKNVLRLINTFLHKSSKKYHDDIFLKEKTSVNAIGLNFVEKEYFLTEKSIDALFQREINPQGNMYLIKLNKNECKIGWSANICERIKNQKAKYKCEETIIFDKIIPISVEKSFHSKNRRFAATDLGEIYYLTFNDAFNRVNKYLKTGK